MAAGKLQEVIPTRPITYRNQNLVNLSLLALAIASGVYLSMRPGVLAGVRGRSSSCRSRSACC